MLRKFFKVLREDKLVLVRFVLQRLRAFLWKLYCRIYIKDLAPGKRLCCIGWPIFTHSSGLFEYGDNCYFGNGVFKVSKGSIIKLGNSVLINNGFVIASGASIQIGDNVMIGEYVSIHDSDHGSKDLITPMTQQPMVSSPGVIDENVWIGRGAVILKGVKIGKGSIIAANSVVNKSIKPYSVVGGVPAKLLKKRE